MSEFPKLEWRVTATVGTNDANAVNCITPHRVKWPFLMGVNVGQTLPGDPQQWGYKFIIELEFGCREVTSKKPRERLPEIAEWVKAQPWSTAYDVIDLDVKIEVP